MKNLKKNTAISILLLSFTGLAWANGKLATKGSGKDLELDVSQFPQDQHAAYDLFKARCTKCHALARPIAALQDGKTPITQSDFDEAGIKTYVVKMMRKPNSGITKSDAKTLIQFLRHARKKAQGK